MSRRKRGIPNTTIVHKISNLPLDIINNNVLYQVGIRLYCRGWNEIVTPVDRITPHIVVRDCIIDIMRRL